MNVGDVILVSGNTPVISKTIEFVTGSKWTHAALYVGGGNIIEIDWNTKAQITVNPYPSLGVEYQILRPSTPLTKEQRDKVIVLAGEMHDTGTKYDWLKLIGLIASVKFPRITFLHKLNKKKEMICTEMIDEIYKAIGIELFPGRSRGIFPHELLYSDKLYKLVGARAQII